ncbi:hypothetical protein PC128_g4843 [Phytophthora cactorum]|nr:hypothetical protein PC120_g6662 [Phytophthora cactorum]KAG3200090.1 hypothetical protein PC128_g4843 [Phytophthora cactorum]KAG4060933.1 hypothetical protein PC123_g4189 [Phytophthora cactorum]
MQALLVAYSPRWFRPATDETAKDADSSGQVATEYGVDSEDLNLDDARDLQNDLLEIKPSFANYLAPSADIVLSPEFESGVVKVLGGHEKDLTRAKKAALRRFQRVISRSSTQEAEPTKLGFADRLLKCRNVQDEPSTYVLLAATPPMSNKAERLFSLARMIMRYERNRLSPLMLEMLLFLKVNIRYGDIITVAVI